MTLTDKAIEIECTDNGYIFSWRDNTDSHRGIGQYPPRKTSGREVFTNKQALLRRVEGFL